MNKIALHLHKVFPSYCLILFLLTLLTIQAAGQGKNEEVTIIAPYIPSLGNAAKIPFRPEIRPEEEQKAPEFEYSYLTKKYEVRLETDDIEPVKYSGEEKEQLYRNYARFGMGNYATPYLDFNAASLQSEKYLFGVRLKHLSSQGKIRDYAPSAYSHNLFDVYGKVFTSTHTISGDIGYKRDVVHFYGFVPDSFPDIEFTKDDLKQRFQLVHGKVEFGSNYTEAGKLNHKVSIGLNFFSDYYKTKESEVILEVGLNKAFKTSNRDFSHSFSLDMGLDFFGYRDSIDFGSPFFIPIRPVYRFSFGQYRFEAGLDIEMAGGSTNTGSSFGIDVFPLLRAEVIVIEERVKAFAEVSGKRTANSFHSLAVTNPFITSVPVIVYTDEQIKVGGGITGNFGGVNFTADAFYSYLNDMPLFVTDTSLEFDNKFNLIYENMNLLKIRASLGYIKLNRISARLMAAYFHYIPKNELKAWQMPNFEVDLDAGYTFLEKYTLRATVYACGTKYARTFSGDETVATKIKGAFDLGAGFDYRINRMITAYADVNNILNQRYQRWYHYPVQGILVMAGVKISF